ncbi:MAG: hypothetical protein SGPRY_004011 [Prymnesium sp.]
MPVYCSTTLGPQVVSSRKSAPGYGFGTASRSAQSKVFMGVGLQHLVSHGHDSPGPSAYQQNTAVARTSSPAWGFGSAKTRSKTSSLIPNQRPSSAPGPGAYRKDVESAVGKQQKSTRPSSAQYGFGTSNRTTASRVFISREHMAGSSFNADTSRSPGPASSANKRPASSGFST